MNLNHVDKVMLIVMKMADNINKWISYNQHKYTLSWLAGVCCFWQRAVQMPLGCGRHGFKDVLDRSSFLMAEFGALALS